MPKVTIGNPVINSPFEELQRHFSKYGEWTFLEITDPWDMQNTIREFMSEYAS